MKINFNGVTKEMTSKEIKTFEDEKNLLENNNSESDITQRINKLEKQSQSNATEVASLQRAFGIIKDMLGLGNLTKL